ncbi:hypothetical protein FSP39_020106 [Pinctada imbricata]|uniref:Uncharacterized protein n=1 Tax=Pinctada imbricata TaxID=66713 RepID=A0AA88YJJ5_PINIB|nr:hypothetical protein FSP39_020106 [Pinctada imbricata]
MGTKTGNSDEDGFNKESEEVGISIYRRRLNAEIKDLKSFELLRAGLAEIIGTFILVLFAVCAGLYPENTSAVYRPSSVHIALEAGFCLSIIIASLWNISGGHVNPAVTIGFLVTGQFTFVRFLVYFIAQLIGAVAAGGVVKVITLPELQHGSFGVVEPGSGIEEYQAVISEFLITFFLLFAVFSFIDPGREDTQGAIPYMIELIVTVNIFATWNISGGCMNPARNFGPAVVTGNLTYQWIYWVGPMVGGATGALCYDKIFSTGACKRWRTGCAQGNDVIEEADDYDGVITEKTALHEEPKTSV